MNHPLTEKAFHPYKTRQEKMAAILKDNELDALALNPGASLEYFTGLKFHLSERPVICLLFSNRTPIIIHPELESGKMRGLPFPINAFGYGEDPGTWSNVFKQGIEQAGLRPHPLIGIDPRGLRILEFRLMEAAIPDAEFISAESNVAHLRMHKDENEILAMRKAVEIAQLALSHTIPSIKVGLTERELAAELTSQLFRSGSDPEMPFTPIVSAGPNSANPHATPTDRQLASGDLLVIDWGASYQGYFSDLTRTFAIGDVDPEYRNINSIVAQANAAGRAQAAPGIPAESIDQAARQVIESAGYANYFTHRTGHGLGMESHEEPYIRSGNRQLLEPGMVFTIEPGIYLPDRNGSRIEDDVVITRDGALCLSDFPRELITVG